MSSMARHAGILAHWWISVRIVTLSRQLTRATVHLLGSFISFFLVLPAHEVKDGRANQKGGTTNTKTVQQVHTRAGEHEKSRMCRTQVIGCN